jgi:hypothetical protein
MLLQTSTYQSHIHICFMITKPVHCKHIFWWVGLGLISMVQDEEAGHSFVQLFHASLFVHALWVFTPKISQTSLGLHPKPKTSFCDHLLVQNPIWVWSKILDGDSNILKDYGIYTYFSSHFPSLLCSRTSIVQAWGRSHSLTQMPCKYYVAKSFEEQKKKWWKKKKIMMRRKEK